MIYPTPREVVSADQVKDGRNGPFSRFVGDFLSNPENTFMLFLQPMRGVVQYAESLKPSVMLPFTPPTPTVPVIPKQLRALIYPEPTLESRHSAFMGQRLDVAASIDILFQRPRAGVAQVIEEANKSHLVSVPVADAPPPFPFELFLRPRRIEQSIVEQSTQSMFVGQFLDMIQAPGDTSLLFLQPRRAPQQPTSTESESQFIFSLEPFVDILFLRPLHGIVQQVEEFSRSGFVRVPVADTPSPFPDLFLLQARRAIQHPTPPGFESKFVFRLDSSVPAPAAFRKQWRRRQFWHRQGGV